ncbi:hypothetical protein RB594_007636 [Gaeumannomyces avenae]
MSLYSDPPSYRDVHFDKPTLLVCWWITIFSTALILIRTAGRFVRSETLFVEDRIAAVAIVPLFARMACVHVVLVYGTNNADFSGVNLTPQEIRNREIASRLVLLSRIFHAATLWVYKAAILEYFHRLTGVSWSRSYRVTLIMIRCLLGLTFLAVVISDLAECRPFSNYWQVLPDPGGQCRQGYANLLTMATCNILTDLLLVFFPIPLILRSAMTTKRKFQLVSLFCLSLAVVGTTIYRVPQVFKANGRQQTRSLLASIEILFATGASNSLVLGTFVRDRGTKKRRFKYGSIMESVGRSSDSRSRRPTVVRHWGSDEDLVRDLGLGVQPDLRDVPESPGGRAGNHPSFFQPAPLVRPVGDMEGWQFPSSSLTIDGRRISGGTRSDSSLLNGRDIYSSRSNSTTTPRKVSFFDVGGLLPNDDDDNTITTRRDSITSGVDPLLSPRASSFVASGSGSVPAIAMNASSTGTRRGSTQLLQDLGVLFGSLGGSSSGASPGGSGGAASGPQASSRASARSPGGNSQPPPTSSGTELKPIPQEPRFESAYAESPRRKSLVLRDAGGLLGPPR